MLLATPKLRNQSGIIAKRCIRTMKKNGNLKHLIITMMCNQQPIRCLFDTGAEAGLITQSAVNRLGIQGCINLSQNLRINGVSGTNTVENCGCVPQVDLVHNNESFSASFIISPHDNKGYDCIVGGAFMSTHGVCLDFAHKIIKIGGQIIPFNDS